MSARPAMLPAPGDLRVEPLTEDLFAPYGRVVAASGPGRPVNQGRATQYASHASLPAPALAARLQCSTYRVSPTALPLVVALLERHPHSAQLFVPMAAISYPVIVAPPSDGPPDPAAMRAFLAGPGQAILYSAGVWHYPLATIGTGGDFTMLIWETGRSDDTELVDLPLPRLVHI